MDSHKICAIFQGIICYDISEFESLHAQPRSVVSAGHVWLSHESLFSISPAGGDSRSNEKTAANRFSKRRLLFGSEHAFTSANFGFCRHAALCFGHHKEKECKPNDGDTGKRKKCRAVARLNNHESGERGQQDTTMTLARLEPDVCRVAKKRAVGRSHSAACNVAPVFV